MVSFLISEDVLLHHNPATRANNCVKESRYAKVMHFYNNKKNRRKLMVFLLEIIKFS